MKAFNLLIFSALMFSNVAISKKIPITLYGGNFECSEWISDKNNKKEMNEYLEIHKSGWIAGYMSSYNIATEMDNFPGTNAGMVIEFIKKYCSENPNNTVADAMTQVIKKLHKK
jgi:hypothetical protein